MTVADNPSPLKTILPSEGSVRVAGEAVTLTEASPVQERGDTEKPEPFTLAVQGLLDETWIV